MSEWAVEKGVLPWVVRTAEWKAYLRVDEKVVQKVFFVVAVMAVLMVAIEAVWLGVSWAAEKADMKGLIKVVAWVCIEAVL